MVSNDILEYVEAELGRSTHPHLEDMNDEEASDFFEKFAYETGLNNFSAVILHTEEQDGYDLMEKTALHLQSKGERPQYFIPEKFQDRVKNSEVIDEQWVEYLKERTVEEDLTQTYSEFNGSGRIQITEEESAAETEQVSSGCDLEDYVILSE
ncbi:MAG: hypothetical protein ACLFTA_00735 [Candidatus Nanohaloarchaea archaeon]